MNHKIWFTNIVKSIVKPDFSNKNIIDIVLVNLLLNIK